jgi:hypothetical protein
MATSAAQNYVFSCKKCAAEFLFTKNILLSRKMKNVVYILYLGNVEGEYSVFEMEYF